MDDNTYLSRLSEQLNNTERSLQPALNVFAINSFRRQADQDYIAARSNFRLQLRQQFLFAALQAIEKYLKAILLFHKCGITQYRHSIDKLLIDVEQIQDLEFRVSESSKEFVLYLNKQGMNRYMNRLAFNSGDELQKLDTAVWEIRRYCQPLPQDRQQENYFAARRKITDPLFEKNKHKFSIPGGFLEKVIRHHPSSCPTRKALIWANMCYGTRKRTKVTYRTFSSAEIPPNEREWVRPHLEKLREYIQLPKKWS